MRTFLFHGKKMDPTIQILVLIGIIVLLFIFMTRRRHKDQKLSLSSPMPLRATTTTGGTCLSSSAQSQVQSIQSQVNTLVSNVNTLNPQPSSSALSAFNTAVANVNSEISTLLALPLCSSLCSNGTTYSATTNTCSCPSGSYAYTNSSGVVACSSHNCNGSNQTYNPADGTCICVSPYGLDPSGNCTIQCTFPNSSYTGQACACATNYTLSSTNNSCINPSDTAINSTYLPQIATALATLTALPLPLPTTTKT
jgi:hypothetical protein